MERSQLPRYPTSTYVSAEWKVVYVSVPKAACTSLKWMIAGLQEEDTENFHRSLSREVTSATTIHRRAKWRKTPTLHELPDTELADISPDNGWFMFTMTRHPTARIWSGWQSKLLLREPYWVERFGEEEWMPRVPRSGDDVVEDFQRFVKSIGADPTQKVLRDRHFRQQQALIRVNTTPYSRIYDTSEFPVFLEEFEAHLHGLGWEGELVQTRSNETPLPLIRPLLTREVMAVLEDLYAADYEKLGYADRMPAKVSDIEEFPSAAIDAVGMLVERAERIGCLAAQAQERAARLREIKEQQAAAVQPRSRLRRVIRRLR
jgi:Sulfotransferase family